MLEDLNQVEKLEEITALARSSECTLLLTEYANVQKEIEVTKKKELRLREKLAAHMRDGIPFGKKSSTPSKE